MHWLQLVPYSLIPCHDAVLISSCKRSIVLRVCLPNVAIIGTAIGLASSGHGVATFAQKTFLPVNRNPKHPKHSILNPAILRIAPGS